MLEVHNLKTQFFTRAGVVFAVDDVSFDVGEGETLGIVGESGCGKSVTSLSIMRLMPSPPGKIVGGEILLTVDGKTRDLVKLSDGEMREVRGNDIAMIFQDPMTSLNPVYTVGNQLMRAADAPPGPEPGGGGGAGDRSAASASASRPPRTGSTPIRTSSPAGCASA